MIESDIIGRLSIKQDCAPRKRDSRSTWEPEKQ